MRLPIRSLGLLAAGLMLGSVLAPVAAQQQQSGVDGQVAVRSDGAVYLISNGQRRWVATVVISDDEINAYPEGEPIYAGLAPIGSAQASAPAPKPSASNPAPASTPASGSQPTAPQPTAKPSGPAPAAPDPNVSADLPIDVDIDGASRFEPGDNFKVQIKTKANATCELIVRMPDGKESTEDSKNADSTGRCRYTIEVPSKMTTGEGMLKGSVREGGRVNQMDLPFEVVKGN